MMTRKLLLVFGFFFILTVINTLNAQGGPTNPIILNEYCVSNTPAGYADEKGMLNDYVEIYNNHTQTIDLRNFYLSNDRNNLLKWKFPSNFPQLGVQTFALVWLSGKNTNDGVNFHTNFYIEQCKNQWIIISNAAGLPYDSVFVQPTQAGHVRGRVDYNNIGIGAWRLFTTKSPKSGNGTPSGIDYAPKPQIFLTTVTSFTATNPNVGGFNPEMPQLAFMRLNNQKYDTSQTCFDIFYTLNGSYPIPFYNGANVNGDYYRYIDSNLSVITLPGTTVLRAIAVPRPGFADCSNFLPSFCETNTYFLEETHNGFDSKFGVISISLDKSDTSWFNAQGVPAASIHVEYYDGKKQVSEGYAMITRPPQEEWRTKQKGFYITKDDRLGFGCNFEGDIFNVDVLGTTPRKIFPTLHLKGGDYESHSSPLYNPGGNAATSEGTGLRDVIMQSLAAKYDLNVSPLHIKPVVAFVNGKYWGVYDLREVYDKYYEEFYNGQSPDMVDMDFVHNSQDGYVTYWDGGSSNYGTNFNTTLYNVVKNGPMSSTLVINKVMSAMDKSSFLDYMILNSYAMNSDLWANNVYVAKGGQTNKPGNKWHFYLGNMPSVFNYSAVAPTSTAFTNAAISPCYLYNSINANYLYTPTPASYNGAGNMLTSLMRNTAFRGDYIKRYQDLLNGPLKCDNILKHFDAVADLYRKEMKFHEDQASTPFPGKFATALDLWDSNMVKLRKVIEARCAYFDEGLGRPACYGLEGPSDLSIDVEPAGSGKVKLNTTTLENYIWTGKYYSGSMNLKAIPSSSEYKFHHWELDGYSPIKGALSTDSVEINFIRTAFLKAVFTDKRNDLTSSGENPNIPTGFTPNGDGLNDDFRPLGSAEFSSDYTMTIFNRWGQEVFRSVDPLNAWDGRYKGQEALTGVYAYFITYKNIYNEEKLVKGNVTLTR